MRLHSDLASYNFNDSRRCTVRCSLLLVDLATSALQWLQSWELLHSDSQNAFRSVRTACTLHTVLCLELYSLMLSYIRMAVICMPSYAYTRSGSPHNVIHSASFTVLWFCRVIRVSTRPHPLCNCSYIVSTSHHVLDMYISSFSGSAYVKLGRGLGMRLQ